MLGKQPEKRYLGGSVCEIHKCPTDGHLGLSLIITKKKKKNKTSEEIKTIVRQTKMFWN